MTNKKLREEKTLLTAYVRSKMPSLNRNFSSGNSVSMSATGSGTGYLPSPPGSCANCGNETLPGEFLPGPNGAALCSPCVALSLFLALFAVLTPSSLALVQMWLEVVEITIKVAIHGVALAPILPGWFSQFRRPQPPRSIGLPTFPPPHKIAPVFSWSSRRFRTS